MLGFLIASVFLAIQVIDVDFSSKVPRYRVHYRGWNKSHDSWITKIDVVSIIEKPSSSAATTSGETVKLSSDITPKISSKVSAQAVRNYH